MIFRRYVQSSKTTPSYKTASSQSWGVKPIIENGEMRPACVAILLLGLVAICISCSSAYHIPDDSSVISSNVNEITREKRQVETFDTDDYPMPTSGDAQQDEPGFWDRVVKIAVKLFSRFVEWLNS